VFIVDNASCICNDGQVTELQGWFLIVEVGILAIAALRTLLR
jgi:hypothetical protein